MGISGPSLDPIEMALRKERGGFRGSRNPRKMSWVEQAKNVARITLGG